MQLAEGVFIAPNAEVIGDVAMAERSSVWFSSVVRADGAPVRIGVGGDVQDNCVVESAPGQPAELGDYSSMGHGAALRGSIVEHHVLIAMNATVLPGCYIGAGSIIAANATVPAGTTVPPGSLVVGNQGRVVRQVTDAEFDRIVETSDHYVELGREYREGIGSKPT